MANSFKTLLKSCRGGGGSDRTPANSSSVNKQQPQDMLERTPSKASRPPAVQNMMKLESGWKSGIGNTTGMMKFGSGSSCRSGEDSERRKSYDEGVSPRTIL